MTLTSRPTRSSTRGVLASESRLQMLDTLRKNSAGMDAGELAETHGLHVSTVRFHLGELLNAGLVDSRTESAGGRGRPRNLFYPVTVGGAYTAADARNAQSSASDGYERLARVLAATWDTNDQAEAAAEPEGEVRDRADSDEVVRSLSSSKGRDEGPSEGLDRGRSRRAEAAGRSWAAAQLNTVPTKAHTTREAAAKVNGLFAEVGFDPELRHEGEASQILLHACPFDAVAKDYPHVVCALHLGLLRGALEQLGADVESELRSRVSPNLCMAYIGPHQANAQPPNEQPPAS